MRTVRLLIAFQGTHYLGWQSQRNGKTLQELFETLLAKIFKEKINLHGSSRTDSGVHARGFVAHFKAPSALPDHKIKDALNFYLPQDVVVLSARTVADAFHARYHAKSKTYQYEIWNHRTRPVFDKAPFVLWVPTKLDVRAMRQAAKHLVGKHDFSAFRDSGDDERSAVRNIKSLTILKNGNNISIKVNGDGFLKHMVRIIVGTLISVGRGKLPTKHTITLLKSKDRKKSGPAAKSQGLTLLQVRY